MAYRSTGSYLKFMPHIKSTKKSAASSEQGLAIASSQNHTKRYLRDMPCVQQNQNVYDTLSE